MPFNKRFIKKLVKDFFIETIAVSIAYVVDISLRDPEKSNNLFVTTFSLRMYYLSKNLLNIVDATLNKSTVDNHVNAALFNMGVGALLYPSTHHLYGEAITERMAAAAVVYTGGIVSRGLTEIIRQKQTIKSHLKLHSGNLTSGALGIAFSSIKEASIATPSFYWSGEGIDLVRNKTNGESLNDVIWSAKATVPLQVFLAYFIKVSLTATHTPLPLPGYAIDFFLGNMHRTAVHIRDGVKTAGTSAPVVTENKMMVSSVSRTSLARQNAVVLFQQPKVMNVIEQRQAFHTQLSIK